MEERKLDIEKTYKLIDEAIDPMDNPGDILEACLEVIVEGLIAERGFIMVYDSNFNELNALAVKNIDPETIHTTAEVSLTIINEVYETEKPAMSVDAVADPRYKDKSSVIISALRSFLCAPIMSPQGLLGLLYVDNRARRGAYMQNDLQFLVKCATKITDVILTFFPKIKPKPRK